MVKADYWDVDDAQVTEKTGYPLAYWTSVLSKAGAATMRSNDVVALLQTQHGVPRYWARTLTTRFSRQATDAVSRLYCPSASGAVHCLAGSFGSRRPLERPNARRPT